MSWIFNPPPGWPQPPEGWRPRRGWMPDPAWPPAPEQWAFWTDPESGRTSTEMTPPADSTAEFEGDLDVTRPTDSAPASEPAADPSLVPVPAPPPPRRLSSDARRRGLGHDSLTSVMVPVSAAQAPAGPATALLAPTPTAGPGANGTLPHGTGPSPAAHTTAATAQAAERWWRNRTLGLVAGFVLVFGAGIAVGLTSSGVVGTTTAAPTATATPVPTPSGLASQEAALTERSRQLDERETKVSDREAAVAERESQASAREAAVKEREQAADAAQDGDESWPEDGQEGANVFYPTCDAVREAGRAPLLRGDPGYRGELDWNHDGVACD